MRSAAWLLANASLPIWSCSVWGLPCPRRYRRSGALFPHLFTLTPALEMLATAVVPGKPGQHGYCVSREALQPHPKKRGGVAEAVCFLWHWPSTDLEVRVPDVIRHTALRSSDFPPPDCQLALALRQRPPGPPASC